MQQQQLQHAGMQQVQQQPTFFQPHFDPAQQQQHGVSSWTQQMSQSVIHSPSLIFSPPTTPQMQPGYQQQMYQQSQQQLPPQLHGPGNNLFNQSFNQPTNCYFSSSGNANYAPIAPTFPPTSSSDFRSTQTMNYAVYEPNMSQSVIHSPSLIFSPPTTPQMQPGYQQQQQMYQQSQLQQQPPLHDSNTGSNGFTGFPAEQIPSTASPFRIPALPHRFPAPRKQLQQVSSHASSSTSLSNIEPTIGQLRGTATMPQSVFDPATIPPSPLFSPPDTPEMQPDFQQQETHGQSQLLQQPPLHDSNTGFNGFTGSRDESYESAGVSNGQQLQPMQQQSKVWYQLQPADQMGDAGEGNQTRGVVAQKDENGLTRKCSPVYDNEIPSTPGVNINPDLISAPSPWVPQNKVLMSQPSQPLLITPLLPPPNRMPQSQRPQKQKSETTKRQEDLPLTAPIESNPVQKVAVQIESDSLESPPLPHPSPFFAPRKKMPKEEIHTLTRSQSVPRTRNFLRQKVSANVNGEQREKLVKNLVDTFQKLTGDGGKRGKQGKKKTSDSSQLVTNSLSGQSQSAIFVFPGKDDDQDIHLDLSTETLRFVWKDGQAKASMGKFARYVLAKVYTNPLADPLATAGCKKSTKDYRIVEEDSIHTLATFWLSRFKSSKALNMKDVVETMTKAIKSFLAIHRSKTTKK